MICSKCGAYNPDYYVFCQNCFADLSDFGVPDGSEVPSSGAPGKTAPPPQAPPPRMETPAPAEHVPAVDMPGEAESLLKDEFQEDVIIRSTPAAATLPDDMPPYAEETVQEIPPPPSREMPRVESPPPSRMTPPPPVEPANDFVTAQRPAAEKPSSAELRRQRKAAEREARELQKLQANQGAEYYDYYDYYDEAALRKERRRSRVVVAIFWLILLAAIAVAIALGALWLNSTYGSVKNGIDSILGGRMPVTVEPFEDAEDGSPGHKITIAGKKGQVLTFRNPEIKQSFELFSNDAVAYRLADKSWIHMNPEPNQDKMVITPDVILTDPDGTETTVEVPSFEIAIPQVTLSLTAPNPTENVIVEGGVLEISGKADAGGNPVQVYVAEYLLGENEIDGNGNFNARIAVANDFDILVVAKSERMRAQSVRIQGKASPGGEFKLNESFANPVESDTVNVTGTAPTGGDLQVTGTAGDISYNPGDGQFSFVARLPVPGLHSFTLKVGEKTQSIAIRRVPEVNAYTGSAVPLDYAAVLAAPGENVDKVFAFDATVVGITAQTPVYSMKMAIDGDPSKPVDVTYFGMAQPQVGESYRVYASANGNSENNSVIRVNAFFVYDQAALSGAANNNASAAPSPTAAP